MRKQMNFAIALLVIAIGAIAIASCSSNDKYKDKLDELKYTLNLPADAVIIKQFGVATTNGSSSSSDTWCVFVLGGDTILYQKSGGNSEHTMTKVDSRIVETTDAKPVSTKADTTAAE